MEERKKIMVVGKAEEADRGAWVVSIDGMVFVRASAVKAFVIKERSEEPGKYHLVALTSFGDEPDFFIVADDLTEEEARRELVSRLA